MLGVMKMTSGTNYKQGDVILVSFPFTDLENSKRRPALIVSNDLINQVLKDSARNHSFWALPISCSQIKQANVIPFSPQDLKMFTSDQTCVVKPWNIFTISGDLVIKKLGRVSSSTLQAAIAAVHQYTTYETGRR